MTPATMRAVSLQRGSFWPAAQAIYQSVLIQDPFGLHTEFVWLENFRTILTDPLYLGSIRVTVIFSASVAGAQAIVLCESAIDALSCRALHPAYRCLSTSGARPHPAWLSSLLQQPLPVFCGFDADPTGDAMALRMIELHPAIARLRPPAKDWNDTLRLQSL